MINFLSRRTQIPSKWKDKLSLVAPIILFIKGVCNHMAPNLDPDWGACRACRVNNVIYEGGYVIIINVVDM